MDIYAAADLMKRERKTIFDLEINVTFMHEYQRPVMNRKTLLKIR